MPPAPQKNRLITSQRRPAHESRQHPVGEDAYKVLHQSVDGWKAASGLSQTLNFSLPSSPRLLSIHPPHPPQPTERLRWSNLSCSAPLSRVGNARKQRSPCRPPALCALCLVTGGRAEALTGVEGGTEADLRERRFKLYVSLPISLSLSLPPSPPPSPLVKWTTLPIFRLSSRSCLVFKPALLSTFLGGF